MEDCLFCKIVKGEIPSTKVYEGENVIAFNDIQPLAKEHYLFIHKEHSKNVNEMTNRDPQQLAQIFEGIQEFTQSNNLERDGFRVVTNINQHGCQSVFHTHFHVLGGEQLRGFGS